jgi:ribose transport system substrate-binding protein
MATGFSRRQALAGLPFVFLAGSCNRRGGKLVGVIPMGRAHVFWQSIHAGAAKASQETGIAIEWNGPASEMDISTQIQIVDTMVNKRIDAIAIAPIDRKALAGPVERAAKAGIPVIVFDSPVETDAFTAQITTDNYKGGRIAGERMASVLNGKGKVAIVGAQAGSASTLAREKGFEDYIRSSQPGIQIVDKRFGDSEVAKSMRVTENMLTAFPDLSAFFASNETGSAGAAQALKSRGSAIKLVGFDSSPALQNELRAGTIDALVVQHPFRMGYDSVQCAAKKFRGESVERIQTIEPRLVTRENVDTPEVQEQINPDLKRYLSA